MAAQHAEGDGQFHGEEPQTLVLLGHGEGEDAGLGESCPQGASGAVVAGCPGPYDARCAGGSQHAVQRAGELPLLVVGEEPHHRRPFGSPSSRSAMMSRWISLVPA